MHSLNFHSAEKNLSISRRAIFRTFAVFLLFVLTDGPVRAEDASSATALAAVRGLIQRLVPGHADRFAVEVIAADGGLDVFEVETRDGRVVLRGNNGVSLASALNWYLQNECHGDISWQGGDQLRLSAPLPVVSPKVRVVSPHRYRFAYNFCTHAYTMAWWDWPQWERELDYLALKGINLALIIEGQESVWIETLQSFGYSEEQVRSWLVMPSHQPWMYMDNLESYGGPVPGELVARRLELGRRILGRMRELGIAPVLPGYYGMVPPKFSKRFPEAKVHSQGDWEKLRRPDILDPADPLFAKVAAAYYAAQDRLFGGAHYYAADPFHEGGSTADIDIPAAGRAILGAMGEATWVLQSWNANPRQEMIAALDKDRLLILDLHGEQQENWRLRNNFDGTPWLWCTIHNFGGNVDLGGRLDWLAAGPVAALHDSGKGRMSGIGALMEGSQVNPVLWEFFFQNVWNAEAPVLGNWLKDYSRRRYGAAIPSAEQAWAILAATVYNAPVTKSQYPGNSALCARPSLKPNQRARPATVTQPHYDTTQLTEAWRLLLDAAPAAQARDGYRYDLCDVGRQVLADLGTRYHHEIIAAYEARDGAALRDYSGRMLGLIRDLDELVGTRREFLLGTWLADARSWGQTWEEKNLCERNARELLTVWTDLDNITDYSNRQWNGLLGEFYHQRWTLWLNALADSLARGGQVDVTAERRKIRDWERVWTGQHDRFPVTPVGDTILLSKKLFEKYAPEASRLTLRENGKAQ